MPDSTSVKVDINRIYESNWKEELEDRQDMVRRVKSRIRDMVMTTPREMESSCGSKIDWIDWAGVEIESEMDSLIEYAIDEHILNWIRINFETGYEDDVEFP